MVLDDNNIKDLVRSMANMNNMIMEVFQKKDGSFLYGPKGLVMHMLRSMQQDTTGVRRLGIIVPDGYKPTEQEQAEIIT